MAKKDTKKAKDSKKESKKTEAATAPETAPVQNGAGGGAMPLFYKNPQPLDAKAHADIALKQNFGFGFTTGVNAVPINLIEMPQICHFYPIAFSFNQGGQTGKDEEIKRCESLAKLLEEMPKGRLCHPVVFNKKPTMRPLS